MTWLIIALVLVIAIGPVMYLLPSKKDKRLSALREQARKLGLNVRITHVRKLDPTGPERVSSAGEQLDPKVNCVAYGRSVRANLVAFQDLQLIKVPAEPTVPLTLVMEGWSCGVTAAQSAKDTNLLDQPGLLQALAPLLNNFPPDCVAVELTNREIACLWRERAEPESDAVNRLATVCEQVEQLLESHIAHGVTGD